MIIYATLSHMSLNLSLKATEPLIQDIINVKLFNLFLHLFFHVLAFIDSDSRRQTGNGERGDVMQQRAQVGVKPGLGLST